MIFGRIIQQALFAADSQVSGFLVELSEPGAVLEAELVVLYITDPAELNFNSPYVLARAFAFMPKAPVNTGSDRSYAEGVR